MFKVFSSFIKIIFKDGKKYFLNLTFSAVVNVAKVLLTSFTISGVLYILENNLKDKVILGAVFFALVYLSVNFIEKYCSKLLRYSQIEMLEKIDHSIFLKLLDIPYSYLENQKYIELAKKSKYALNNEKAVEILFDCLTNIFLSLVSVFAITAVVFTLDYKLLIILLVINLCSILAVALFSKFERKFWQNNIDVNIKFDYYMDVLSQRKNAPDFKFYKIGSFLIDKFHQFGLKLCETVHRYNKKSLGLKVLLQVLKTLENFIVYAVIIYKFFTQTMAISTFSFYINIVTDFSKNLFMIFNKSISLNTTIKYIEPFVEIMKLENQEHTGEILLEKIETIEFRDVVFSYNNTQNAVLDKVSFTVNKGEKISIVGLNGAGKSTIIKLLLRLYPINQGEILVNGISIYRYEYNSYIKNFSALFQDFNLFAFSIKDNISFEINRQQCDDILQKVGLYSKVSRFKNESKTIYTKEFDDNGAELSGGEKQKLALARTICKNSDLMIFDEPTSAMDAKSELEFYENIIKLAQDKTILYVSHRMASSQFSDKILVISQGKVTHLDTHANLMKQPDSLYAQLFNKQAKQYI